MDTHERRVVEVLTDSKRFIVPIYQRQYAWGDAELAAFWDDVVAKAEEALEHSPRFAHFMGALILAPGSDGYTLGATPKVMVIDGQQRLTTFQLFIVALRDVARAHGMPDLVAVAEGYITMPQQPGDRGEDARYRLVPTPADKAMFHLLVESGLEGVHTAHADWFAASTGRIFRNRAPASVYAAAFFRMRIEAYVFHAQRDEDEEADPSEAIDARRRIDALLSALLQHLKLVVITLNESDDAQVIFETLNSRGRPLLAMDLVRNNIFHRASGQGESAEALFEAKWRPFDAAFWKEDAPRAKPKRPRIDHFLSHALTAQTGQETSLRELYAEYRAFARPRSGPRFQTVAEELDALTRFAPIYETLERGDPVGGPLASLGQKLNLWEVSTAYPLVFHVAVTAEPADAAIIYRLIESYVVRRAMLGLSPKNFNKTFGRVVTLMLEQGTTPAVFASAFDGARGDTVRFPDDGEFTAGVVDKPIYQMIGRKERLADILWQIECAARTKYHLDTGKPPSPTIEHIMPQSWAKHWPLPNGARPPIEYVLEGDEQTVALATRRRQLVQTLGNLTLSTQPANATMSNAAFNDKKPWLKKSLMALNLELDEHVTWTEAQIEARSRSLAKAAVGVWPSLQAFVARLAA